MLCCLVFVENFCGSDLAPRNEVDVIQKLITGRSLVVVKCVSCVRKTVKCCAECYDNG